MQTEKHKTHIRLSFGVGLFSIVLVMITFWNAFFHNKDSVAGILPFLFGIMAIGAFTYMYIQVLKATNPQTLNDYIEEQINKEKKAILSDLKKEDTDEKESEDVDEQEIIEKIIPEGNFKKIDTYSKKLLSNLAKEFNLGQAIIYKKTLKSKKFSFVAGFALTNEEPIADFKMGEGLNGEAAQSQESMVIDDIPEDYFEIVSGLGATTPKQLVILPIVNNKNTIALIEMAAYSPINNKNIKILEKFSDIVSDNLNQLLKV